MEQGDGSFLNDNYLSISDNSIVSDINGSYFNVNQKLFKEKSYEEYDMAVYVAKIIPGYEALEN